MYTFKDSSGKKHVPKIMSPMAMAMESDFYAEPSFQEPEEIQSTIHYFVHDDNTQQSSAVTELYDESTCSNFPSLKKKSTYKCTSKHKQYHSPLPAKDIKSMQNEQKSQHEYASHANLNKNEFASSSFRVPIKKSTYKYTSKNSKQCNPQLSAKDQRSKQKSKHKYTSQANLNECHTPTESSKSVSFFMENSVQDKKLERRRNNSPNKNSDLEKVTKKHSRHSKKYNFTYEVKNNSSNNAPLLTFRSMNIGSENYSDVMQFSDDDYSNSSQASFGNRSNSVDFLSDDPASVSQNISISSPKDTCPLSSSADDTYFDNLDMDEADSSEESDNSDLNSEYSTQSSFVESELGINISKSAANKEDSFVSVFWDLENCALPPEKSAVDFANYIRGKFYGSRTEIAFIAVCDVSNLSPTLMEELDEATITAVHTSSHNKNEKIMTLLKRFQAQYQRSNSAVVLICTDSYFGQILLDMRFQHHIFVNLICQYSVQSRLITVANNYTFFESILKILPDQDVEESLEHVLIVTNVPLIGFQQIKDCLPEVMKNFNCRFKHEDSSEFKIVFENYDVCRKAMKSLKGLYLNGHPLNVKYQQEMHGISVAKGKKKCLKSVNNSNQINTYRNVEPKSNVTNTLSAKPTTVCVTVSIHAGDIKYWESEFQKTLKMNDFSISCDSAFGGCFLINFKSLKQAQRAKKILFKNQMKDPLAPKFLKLIKQDGNCENVAVDIVDDIGKLNMKKAEEHLQIVEKKKVQFLKKHENVMLEIKNQAMPETTGASDALMSKLRECEEQMKTFRNFTCMIMDAIGNLNCHSEDFDHELKELLCDFTRECNCITSALPIYAKKEEIRRKIEEHQVIIIRAETGSGKSTQLTQYIWRARKNFNDGIVICTQPRKIAAISLAKHVSMQIGSCLGDLVGYEVGMNKKLSTSTKIKYVTDFTMLKILISGNLNDVSCIIVDEAHERTIYTDILLGILKWYLPNYPQLKIVITSATIDTSIFRDYFSLTDSAVLNISGRTFPIEDVWSNSDSTPDGDYFNYTIGKTFEILSEEPGDVLSFLTTPLETEKAMENFSKKLRGTKNERNVKVFCLHGKMNPEEQQKVFVPTPRGMRKVIFSTNCAETSITIPGIKYVIDCGLVKESKYDANRNMNVLSVGFVSKSSAEQRRGRAGRTQVGKCYRLYSKKNYNCMADSTDPEILRINLGQALLKLLKMGVEDPLRFDFIQSPPKEMLNAAMDQLLYLNAVDEKHALTDLGDKMAVLPLEPRLCHLIFQGFDNDIGYDALVISALITMSHAIFFRNSENKDEADAMKRRFCESESDFLSYLAVYREWSEVPKNSKSQWCTINCINARSMRTVHELVNEIILILQRELNLKVKQKFGTESAYETLTRTIFYSFSQNLAVFSGHPRYGYRCLNVSEQLFIHPSSSLSVFGKSTPEFVVYDTILKTTQTFIVNVCPVTKDMIKSVVDTYNLKIDLIALGWLVGNEICIKPVGEKILLSHFIGKKGSKCKELQKKIKEITQSDFIEVDIDTSKGCIKIFGFLHSIVSEVESFVLPILRDAKGKLLKEEKDVCLSENGSLTAILGAGGVIVDVILPEEFRDIKVILKGLVSIDTVLEKLSECGTISDVRDWRQYFKVTFRSPFSAKKALDLYSNEKDFLLRKIQRYSRVNEKEYLYKVFMSFLRRPCTGLAFIGTEPRVSHLSLSNFSSYNGRSVILSTNRRSGDICVNGLPADTDKKELEKLVQDSLPCDTVIKKCVVLRKQPYESPVDEMESIKKNVVELFSEFTFKEHLTVSLRKPNANDIFWNATVYFKNSHHGETAVNVLRNRSGITNFKDGLVFKPELKTFISCKPQIFSAVKEEIDEALQFFKRDQPADSLLDVKSDQKSSDLVEVRILSNNVRDVTDARRCIHKILMGDELQVDDSSKRKLFSHSGQEFIKKLSLKFENCYILCNDHNKTLSIFGKEASCNEIKIFINEFLNCSKDEDLREISLKTDSGKTGVLKALLKKYGYDLEKLKKDCEVSDIIINKYKQILVVQGSSSSIAKCESVVQDIKEKLEENCSDLKGEICPVCCDEVSEVKRRLEYCGHAYCVECLLHLFQNSEDIPLLCEVESCKEHIVLNDIFWAVKGRKSLEKALFAKFLNSFVDSHDNISFCPSPDCPMVFRLTQDRMDIYRCSACGNSLCTKCGDLYHFGTTCSFNKCLQHSADKTIQAWLKEDPHKHKLCPSCSSPIEKYEGCNHMTCWKCKCHMCWLCLQVFPTGSEVYLHQRSCQGNTTT